MLDVWIGDCLLLLAIPTYMVSAVMRLRPRLLPGDGVLLEDLGTLQTAYENRYPMRLLLLRVAPALLAIHFGLPIVRWNAGLKAEGPSIVSVIIAAFAVYIGSMIGVVVLRIRHERAFVMAHPDFADSFLPVRPRILAILPWILSLLALVASFLAEDTASQFPLLGLGLVGLLMGLKLRSRQILESRYELPWDEPLGNRVADVVERFGHKPKKLVLLPSLVANAAAMRDGSVVVTSALRSIATPAEVAAVVAHELSHVRDGEGRKWTRLRLISGVPLGALAGLAIALGQGQPFEAFIPSAVGFGLVTLWMVPAWWVGLRTRLGEFKCDADAANLGLGLDLATCLDKITRFMGMPSHWIGIDRFLLTHPSLEERTARLCRAAGTACGPQEEQAQRPAG